MTVTKYKYETIENDYLRNGNDLDAISEEYRECSRCDMYVSVDDFSSEGEVNGKIIYDICDQCSTEL